MFLKKDLKKEKRKKERKKESYFVERPLALVIISLLGGRKEKSFYHW